MAEAQDLELGEVGKSSNKKLFVIIGAVALLAIVGVAAFFLMSGESSESETEEDAEPIVVNTTYVDIPQPILVNIPGTSKPRMVKMTISFSVTNPELAEKVKKHLPLLRSEILVFTATQDADVLMTPEGQAVFRQQMLEKLQAAMEAEEQAKLIDRVLFTSFVMQ